MVNTDSVHASLPKRSSPIATSRGGLTMSSFNLTSESWGGGQQGGMLPMPGTPMATTAASNWTSTTASKLSHGKGTSARNMSKHMMRSATTSSFNSMRSTSSSLSPLASPSSASQLRSQSRPGSGTLASLKVGGSVQKDTIWAGVPSMPPRLHSEYLGVEAIDRFRLVANLSHASVGGKTATRPPTGLNSKESNCTSFMCMLCEQKHSIHNEASIR
jgi:hypothetical protein